MATGKAKHVIQGNVFDRSLSDDAKWLITGHEETTVRIWDVETGKEVRAFAGHKKPVAACSVSSDKKLLVTYDQSGTVRLWDAVTGKELRVIEVRTGLDRRWQSVDFHVRVSRDAKLLVSWTPSRLTLWDLEKGNAIRSMDRKIDE